MSARLISLLDAIGAAVSWIVAIALCVLFAMMLRIVYVHFGEPGIYLALVVCGATLFCGIVVGRRI